MILCIFQVQSHLGRQKQGNIDTLFMLYKGQSIWDARQYFGKNKGQSIAFSNGARDKNTLPWQGTQAKFGEK